MKDKVIVNSIDRLEVAYKYNDETLNNILSNLNEDGILNYGEFWLEKSDIVSEFEFNFNILAPSMPNEDGNVDVFVWGKLQWGSHRKTNVYINVSNEVFYNNTLSYLHYIDTSLGLEFYKIDKLDLAIDCNFNIIKRFYSILKNEEYTPIIFNKAYDDLNEKIPSLFNGGSGTRKRPYLNKSFELRKKSDYKSLSLHCYNKLEEIKDNNNEKQYIIDKIDMKPIFRLEARCKVTELDYTLNQMNLNQTYLYMNLFNDSLLFNLSQIIIDRIIRIKHKSKILPLLYCLINY